MECNEKPVKEPHPKYDEETLTHYSKRDLIKLRDLMKSQTRLINKIISQRHK